MAARTPRGPGLVRLRVETDRNRSLSERGGATALAPGGGGRGLPGRPPGGRGTPRTTVPRNGRRAEGRVERAASPRRGGSPRPRRSRPRSPGESTESYTAGAREAAAARTEAAGDGGPAPRCHGFPRCASAGGRADGSERAGDGRAPARGDGPPAGLCPRERTEREDGPDRTEPRTGTGPPSSRPARPGGDSPPPEVAGARLPPLARRPFRESAVRTATFRPQVGREDPLDLSISLSGGKETNQDSPSSGERSGKSPAPNPRAPAGAREVWREEVRVPAEPRRRSPLERGCRSSGAGVRPMRARGEAGAGPPGVGLFCNAAQRRVVNSIQG